MINKYGDASYTACIINAGSVFEKTGLAQMLVQTDGDVLAQTSTRVRSRDDAQFFKGPLLQANPTTRWCAKNSLNRLRKLYWRDSQYQRCLMNIESFRFTFTHPVKHVNLGPGRAPGHDPTGDSIENDDDSDINDLLLEVDEDEDSVYPADEHDDDLLLSEEGEDSDAAVSFEQVDDDAQYSFHQCKHWERIHRWNSQGFWNRGHIRKNGRAWRNKWIACQRVITAHHRNKKAARDRHHLNNLRNLRIRRERELRNRKRNREAILRRRQAQADARRRRHDAAQARLLHARVRRTNAELRRRRARARQDRARREQRRRRRLARMRRMQDRKERARVHKLNREIKNMDRDNQRRQRRAMRRLARDRRENDRVLREHAREAREAMRAQRVKTMWKAQQLKNRERELHRDELRRHREEEAAARRRDRAAAARARSAREDALKDRRKAHKFHRWANARKREQRVWDKTTKPAPVFHGFKHNEKAGEKEGIQDARELKKCIKDAKDRKEAAEHERKLWAARRRRKAEKLRKARAKLLKQRTKMEQMKARTARMELDSLKAGLKKLSNDHLFKPKMPKAPPTPNHLEEWQKLSVHRHQVQRIAEKAARPVLRNFMKWFSNHYHGADAPKLPALRPIKAELPTSEQRAAMVDADPTMPIEKNPAYPPWGPLPVLRDGDIYDPPTLTKGGRMKRSMKRWAKLMPKPYRKKKRIA
eukprot:TRINITY_DN2319_c0_g1_i2.p1 TRINITY_DN2319_c0_g1~~TRINITY_DN2319_c0_g1_i2.p1  ORF type:complete len:705 (-),score=202.51 TRINITY_DN2319_c0_g1_i2:68-2182(-)